MKSGIFLQGIMSTAKRITWNGNNKNLIITLLLKVENEQFLVSPETKIQAFRKYFVRPH